MAKKLEDQKILDATIDSVLMGTGDVKQQSIEEMLDEVLSKVIEDADEKQKGASQVLRTEAEHRSQVKKKEVLTSSHRDQVLFDFCNILEFYISHTFQIYEIYHN